MEDGNGHSGGANVFEIDLLDDEEQPKMALLEAVADLEGVDETDLDALYPRVDELVEHLFSDPPAAEANAELEFSYEDYRITLFQDGTAILQRAG